MDIEKQAAEANWVGDVKVLLDNLNDLLRKVPDGVDVKVDAGQTVIEVGAVDIFSAKKVWQIDLSATKTKTLI